MLKSIKEYKEKLENSLKEYMQMPANQRSAEAVESMIECYEHITALEKEYEHCRNNVDYMAWNNNMQNEDGTYRGHWRVSDTSNFEKPEGVSEAAWNVAMNMMYSDYYNVALKYGVMDPGFFACMARAFLNDKDAKVTGEDKMAAYYCSIVK